MLGLADTRKGVAVMHVQIVTFRLEGITEAEYRAGCEAETGVFNELPGLLGKIWIARPETNTYGAVYLWRDRDAYAQYVDGEVFQSILDDESLAGVESADYEVLDDLTRATQPGLTLV